MTISCVETVTSFKKQGQHQSSLSVVWLRGFFSLCIAVDQVQGKSLQKLPVILAPALADPALCLWSVKSRAQLLYLNTAQSDISKSTWPFLSSEYFPVPFSECCHKQQRKQGPGLATFFLLPWFIFQICSIR